MARHSTLPPPPVRRTRVQATPVPRHRRRFRRLRRILTAAIVIVLAFLAVQAYLLHVYAPGLRSEAHTIPALVHDELAQHHAAYVPFSAISPNLRHAIVAIEDRRFYEHPGVDPVGLGRALWVNLTEQRVYQGGSTLEEQLVKRAIVHQDRALRAKLRTMVLAWAVDQDFSKKHVLELYLNAAYYGRGAYGAQAAAATYFGTDAANLNLQQAAFLAALPQLPTIYGANPRSPIILGRQQTVLIDMEKSGYITPAQLHTAQNAPLTFAFPNP
jgi:penicillin-binding protein 1A